VNTKQEKLLKAFLNKILKSQGLCNMYLNREKIGTVANFIPIYHGTATFNFSDYDVIFKTLRNKVPISYHHYGEPIMEGLIIYWEDDYKEERISFKSFSDLINDNWHILKNVLECNSDLIDATSKLYRCNDSPDGSYKKGDIYEILSLKYTEMSFQVNTSALCPFDRVSEKVKMFDYFGMQAKISDINNKMK
jgi:hypothetical protein